MDAAGGRDGEEKEEKKGNGGGAGEKRVSFTGLFRYADCTDVLLMILGTVGAMANGVTEPVMTVIFGQVINAFGGAIGVDDVLSRVNKVSSPETPPPRYLAISLLAILFSVAHLHMYGRGDGRDRAEVKSRLMAV